MVSAGQNDDTRNMTISANLNDDSQFAIKIEFYTRKVPDEMPTSWKLFDVTKRSRSNVQIFFVPDLEQTAAQSPDAVNADLEQTEAQSPDAVNADLEQTEAQSPGYMLQISSWRA